MKTDGERESRKEEERDKEDVESKARNVNDNI
jgi:hypothetical protein